MPPPAFERTIGQTPYREIINAEMQRNPNWNEQFAYDREGYLTLKRMGGVRVVDLIAAYGDPYDVGIQITDTTMVTQRIKDLNGIFLQGVSAVGYPHEVQVFYATKANEEAAVVTTAAQSADLEGTGKQNVTNFKFLRDNGVVPPDKRFIFNGFKEGEYAQRIIAFHNEGANVLPNLEPGEFPLFASANIKRVMPLGIRLKSGPVGSLEELAHYTNQFGHSWEDAQRVAHMIAKDPRFKLKQLHGMIAAAETIPPAEFVKSALLIARMYAELKATKGSNGKELFPDLSELNLGGGIPAYGTYPFQEFIQPYLQGVMKIAREYKIEPPKIVVESGTFIASNCQHVVFKIFHHARNDSNGITHAAFNGSILAAVPDVFILNSKFSVVAANHANDRAIPVRLTDRTCDSNDVIPPKNKPHETMLMPENLDDMYISILDTGAYESILGGQGDEKESKLVGHCLNPDPINVVFYGIKHGQLDITASSSPTPDEMRQLLGYNRHLTNRFPSWK